MQDFLNEFAADYAEKFGYTAEVDEESAVIQTPYGTLGFQQLGENEIKFLKISPTDEEDDVMISSLIKINKHFKGALKSAIEAHNEEGEEEEEETLPVNKKSTAKPPAEPTTKNPAAEEDAEVDSLGRTCPPQSNKPPAHFTKPDKTKGGKKTANDKIAPAPEPEAPLPAEAIPGTAAYGIAQRAKEAAAKTGVAVPGEKIVPLGKNALGNSKKAMDAAASATIGGKKAAPKVDPPDEPMAAEPDATEEDEPSLDDVMDGKVAAPPKKDLSKSKSAPAVPPKAPQAAPGELVMEDAAREMAYIKIMISSPSGGGKTLGALLLARGLCDSWGEICILDTENKSGALYVGTVVDGVKIGKYKTITLQAPYTVARYIQAMDMAEKAGIKVMIIDSLTHAWTADGGLLDLHTKITAASRSGNSYTAWKDVTPLHAKLIEKIQTCSMHVILTARSKMEHTLEKTDKGTAPKKVGMGIIFRDGIEYEVSIALEIDQASHVAQVTKDRTMVFSDTPYFTISEDTGRQIRAWLESSQAEE
ncbi:MAG: AAA family ATPase [Candidatus Methanomethylophilaceae archaeon]|jgi:hypothetical protein